MKFEKFEDIIVWRKSQELALTVYKVFDKQKDFSFVNQIQRAAVSISNNIAEGYERKSNNEFKYFLFISKGSNGEVRNMLYIAKSLNYISEQDFQKLYILTLEIGKMISGLIKTL